MLPRCRGHVGYKLSYDLAAGSHMDHNLSLHEISYIYPIKISLQTLNFCGWPKLSRRMPLPSVLRIYVQRSKLRLILLFFGFFFRAEASRFALFWCAFANLGSDVAAFFLKRPFFLIPILVS